VIRSVAKAIRILHLFNDTETRLRLAEISRRLDIPRSTAHNLLNTLRAEGFIEQVDGDLYALGPAPLILSQRVRVNVEIRDPAAPLLRQLADQVNESVYLTVPHGAHALYIYAVESSRRLLARTAVGELVPLHCTSVGKALLAFLPDSEVDRILAEVGLPGFTPNTVREPERLKEELAGIRSRGYATDNQEHEPNTFCIGAPIFDRRGQVIASCSVSGVDPAILGARREGLATLVVETAQEISRRMGYVPTRRARPVQVVSDRSA